MIQITVEKPQPSASQLAQRTRSFSESQTSSYLSFKVGEHAYAVDLLQIREVRSLPQVTRVAHAPFYVLGVASLRGEIVPIIDLKKRFGLPQPPEDAQPLLVLSDIDDRKIAMLVESVNEVIDISSDEIQAIPRTTMAIDMKYLLGMVQRQDQVVLLLDLRKILSPEELHAIASPLNEPIPA